MKTKSKKIEISKKGDVWHSHCLKTGRALGTLTEAQALEHWKAGDAVFVREALAHFFNRDLNANE